MFSKELGLFLLAGDQITKQLVVHDWDLDHEFAVVEKNASLKSAEAVKSGAASL
jgi:hypothetical protein